MVKERKDLDHDKKLKLHGHALWQAPMKNMIKN